MIRYRHKVQKSLKRRVTLSYQYVAYFTHCMSGWGIRLVYYLDTDLCLN